MSSVFLSHNSKDKPWVRKLAQRLVNDGVKVWIDEAEINIGDSLIEKISSGIQEMKFVAAIISKNSVQSKWVQKEINIAMSKEIENRHVIVLPLVIDNCTIPSILADKFYADFRKPDDFEVAYKKLLKAIGIKKIDKSKIDKKKVLPQNSIKLNNYSKLKSEINQIEFIRSVYEDCIKDPNAAWGGDFNKTLEAEDLFKIISYESSNEKIKNLISKYLEDIEVGIEMIVQDAIQTNPN
jgi:hypothetical protein